MRRRDFLTTSTALLGLVSGCASGGPACWDCKGKGKIRCITCNGEGTCYREVGGAEQWIFCVVCDGSGRRKCSTCNGSGQAPVTKT